MSLKAHFKLMADYNQWMNSNLYNAAETLSVEELAEDRGAFFRSILGTLNHIVVGDTLWLKRFASHPACSSSLREVVELPNPTGLDQLLFTEFGPLHQHRKWLDQQIIQFIDGITEGDLQVVLNYQNSKGVAASKRFSSLLLHFFNHQTHHRGQLSTLLSQAGREVGVTDLLMLIPDEQ